MLANRKNVNFQFVVLLIGMFAYFGCVEEDDFEDDDDIDPSERIEVFDGDGYHTGHPAMGSSTWNPDDHPGCSNPNYHYLPLTCGITIVGTHTALTAQHCKTENLHHLNFCNGNKPLEIGISNVKPVKTPLTLEGDMSVVNLSTSVSGFQIDPFSIKGPKNGHAVTYVATGRTSRFSGDSRKRICQGYVWHEHYGPSVLQTKRNGCEAHGSDSGSPVYYKNSFGMEVMGGTTYGGAWYIRTEYYKDVIMKSSNFNARPAPPFKNLSNKRIKRAGTNDCLYVDNSTSKVKIGTCGTASKFKWTFIEKSSGQHKGLFVIRNMSTNKCMRYNSSTGKFHQRPCFHAEDGQGVSVYEIGDSKDYIMITRNSDKCIGGYKYSDRDIRSHICSLNNGYLEWEFIN